ncbi:hypothetical protein RUM44_004119 [Polyplax serrata]|uniref:Uncharacterized protein n=1 Tax=Polyplax serrata TaxID=468196 RepID=A0ABR1B1Y2_POLSC
MSRKFCYIFLAVFVLNGASSLKIPSYFKQCARTSPDFNECAKRNGQKALAGLIGGDRKYRIPNLNPLHIPELNINQNGNLKILLKDAYISGLADTIIQNCDFDFNNRRITINFSLPKLTIQSLYEIAGRILVLPITGKGPSNIALHGLTFSYDYNYGIVRKGNADYLEPKKGKISYTLQGMNLRFDNLFNGDRLLGEETNNFLNENWQDVEKELGPGVVEALAEVVHLILSNVCNLVPFDELFPEVVPGQA